MPVPNLSALVALPPSRVAIVGPSVEYQSYTEAVKLTDTEAVTLTKTGINTTSVVVTSLAGVSYEVTSDYTLEESGSPAEEQVTTITRVDLGDITSGQVVYVTYDYTDSAFYEAFLSSDWDEIQSRYGTAIDPDTGAIGSPLSLAAKIAMEQGVRELILVPTKGSSITAVTAQQLSSAYEKIEAREDVGIVVPLGVGLTGTDNSPGSTTTAGTGLKTHVENASANGQYRIGIYGLDKGASRSHDLVAAVIDSKRVMLAYPNILNWYNGFTNRTMELDGYYLAAAYAGMLASRFPQDPLTRKRVLSFTGIPARVFSGMTVSAKNALSQGGVSVAELTANSRILCRHGVTTDTTSVFTREISIVRAKDAKLRLVYQALDSSGIIGSPITSDTPLRVRSLVEGALAQAVSIGLIVSYSNLAVRNSVADQTTVEVKYAYQPAYPLNKVTVGFSINTATGITQEA